MLVASCSSMFPSSIISLILVSLCISLNKSINNLLSQLNFPLRLLQVSQVNAVIASLSALIATQSLISLYTLTVLEYASASSVV